MDMTHLPRKPLRIVEPGVLLFWSLCLAESQCLSLQGPVLPASDWLCGPRQPLWVVFYLVVSSASLTGAEKVTRRMSAELRLQKSLVCQ